LPVATYTHDALFHDSDDELVAGLVPFVVEGIEADERVVVVVTRAVGELLRDRLEPGAEFDLWNSADVYTSPTHTLAVHLETVRAGTEGGRRMRVAAQPVWEGRSPLEIAEWTCMEAACNVVFAGSPLKILCPYDTSRLDPAVIAAARRTHSLIRHGSHIVASPDFAPFDHQHEVRATELPSRPASAARISIFSLADLATVLSFVETFALARTLAGDRIAAARLAVEELLTRGVDYSLGPARVHMWTSESDLVVEVESTGRLTSPFAGYLPPTMSAGVERGLWLAGQQCDLIAVRQHEGCTTVRLHISDYLVSARPTCDGIDTLLGVFVLRVCDPDEEHLVRTHLANCAACRAEVDRLGHVVGLLDHPGGSTRP
jgi:MEDS: MEthanogen/methylotroph, DcmR Sensory domain/Putative zinc-finger